MQVPIQDDSFNSKHIDKNKTFLKMLFLYNFESLQNNI